jgi:phage tail-like protein
VGAASNDGQEDDMAVLRDRPYGNDQFLVEIEGLEPARFEQVVLPSGGVAVEEYREGSDPNRTSRKLAGAPFTTHLVLRRGFAGSLTLYEWWKSAAQGDTNSRRDVRIVLQDEQRHDVARWKLTSAFPAQYSFSPLDARDGSPLVECLEVAFDTFEME